METPNTAYGVIMISEIVANYLATQHLNQRVVKAFYIIGDCELVSQSPIEHKKGASY